MRYEDLFHQTDRDHFKAAFNAMEHEIVADMEIIDESGLVVIPNKVGDVIPIFALFSWKNGGRGRNNRCHRMDVSVRP
jgi:hypothetical protein